MKNWRDDAINSNVTPIINIIANAIDLNFSKIIFSCWFEDGVQSFSYQVYDSSGRKIMLGPDIDTGDKDEDIRKYCFKIKSEFEKNNENWVAMRVIVARDGEFDIEFEYENPYKFLE